LNGARTERWAVILINARRRCKSRLRSVLSASARVALADDMLQHGIEAVAACDGIDRVLVVSPDARALPRGVAALCDPGMGMNVAAALGCRQARVHGATATLVLPADLPHLTAEDLTALIAAAGLRGVALATDTGGQGTNALLLPAALPFRFAFGPGSRRRHERAALLVGQRAALVQRAGLARDLDTPADYFALAGRATALTGTDA